MKNALYGSSLTDGQWKYLEPMLPKPAKRGRPRTNLRLVLDAIFYVVKGGVPWRFLPNSFRPWHSVYGVFRRWKQTHQWEALNGALQYLLREDQGRDAQPTAAVLDSQSVKSAGHGGPVGYDACKCIKGRKRHLLVDTLGPVLGVSVTPADTTEREGGKAVLSKAGSWFTKLRRLWVDGGYTGDALANRLSTLQAKLEVEVFEHSDELKGFKVLPHRWVVERIFGWLMYQRRLVRNYERTLSNVSVLVRPSRQAAATLSRLGDARFITCAQTFDSRTAGENPPIVSREFVNPEGICRPGRYWGFDAAGLAQAI